MKRRRTDLDIETVGECLIRLDEPVSAIEPLRKAIALAPDDAEAHFILATALNKSGSLGEGARERAICAQLRAKQRAQGPQGAR